MSEVKLDINLNDLFKLSYDFDNLKSALGQILKAMNLNTKTCNETKKLVDFQNGEIRELRQRVDEKDSIIKDLTERIRDLEAESKDHKEQIKNNAETINNHESTLKDHTNRIEKLEELTKELQDLTNSLQNRIQAIDDKLSVLGDGGVDLDSIQSMIDQLKQECDEKYGSKEVLENLEDRVAVLEDTSKEHSSTLDLLKDTKADKKDLKDLFDKIEKLLKEMEEALKWKTSMMQITNRIDKVEIQIQNILKNLGKGEAFDDSLIKTLEEKHNQLRDDFEKFKEDVMGWLRDLQDAIAGKADESALKDLENSLMNRLDELLSDLDKRYADKAETKKALKALEKQIKNLFDMLMSQGSTRCDDDAMFAKRPLGGWSCASCAKDLVNLQGVQADFVPWRQWPFRDPNERLAKSGQGFSRILSKMKSDDYMTQPNFYPGNSMDDNVDNQKAYDSITQEKLAGNQKWTVKKKKKKIRPMSANRAGAFK